MNLLDAKECAEEFMRLFGNKLDTIDEGLMIGWFANTIMAGYDEGLRRMPAEMECVTKERDNLREWKEIILGTGNDQEAIIRMAAVEYTQVAVVRWKQKAAEQQAELDRMMVEAVWAMEEVYHTHPDMTQRKRAHDFLDSPKVAAWFVRQKEAK